MSEMKYSGIKSIGKIPYNWKIKKCKYITEFVNGYAFDSDLMQSSGKYPIVRIGDIDGEKISFNNCLYIDNNAGLDKYKIKKDDLLLAMSGATVGKTGYSPDDFEAYINQRVGIIRSLNNKFINYFLKTDYFHEYVNLMSVGSAQPNISSTSFGEFKISVPNTREQKLIADFLDEKVDTIDNIICNLNNQIEILNKYKKAIITEKITKGLNINNKYKDSGVEWIGNIPEHWSCIRIKYITIGNLNYGANESGIEFSESLPRYIRITDIDENNRLKDDDKQSLIPEIAKNYLLKNDDILFARSGATVGKTFLYKSEYGKSAYAGYLIKATINNKCAVPKYVYYSTLGIGYDNWKNSIFTQSTIQNISADKYSNYKLPLPPIGEQKEIVNYLDKKCSEIDEILNSKIKQKEQMEKYKKSVIYEYVTGKKRVEGAEELYG